MKNVFDGLMSKLDTTEKQSLSFRKSQQQLLKLKSKEKKRLEKKNRKVYPNTMAQPQKIEYICNGDTRRRGRRERTEGHKTLVTKNFFQINVRHQTTDPRCLENTKQNK